MSLSLQHRIWAGSSLVTLAALLVFFFFADGSFRSTVRSEVEQNVATGLTLATQVRSAQFDELLRRVSAYAQEPRLKGTIDTADPATILQVLEEDLDMVGVEWMAVLDLEGVPVAGTGGAHIVDFADGGNLIRDARHYDTGDVRVVHGAVVEIAASPILFGSLPMAILVAGRRIDAIAVSEISTYARQRVAILSDGDVRLGAELGEAYEPRLARWPTEASEFRVDGETFLGSETPILDASGVPVASMLVFQSLDDALAPARRLRVTLLGVAVIALGSAFLIGLVLSRQVTAPVDRLLVEAQRLGEGDLESPIRPMRSDEIGKLAEGFERMRDSLLRAQEELIRSERVSAIGHMASSIVHDFSNPLSSVAMSAMMLDLDGDDGHNATIAREIGRQVERMNGMMREVLEFARGDWSLDARDVDLRGWLDEIETFWSPLLKDHDVSLSIQCGSRGSWRFDPERLRRVVDNLVKNALGALPEGGAVEIRATPGNGHLTLEVADNGSGIPGELHETLFQPFTTTGKKDGTGLGLAIAKSIVERHGGTIDFASSPVGTTFTILVPEDIEACADAA